MAAKTYLVVSNGQWPKEEIWRPLVEDAVHLIACDGAANQCLAQNITMDTVIGDCLLYTSPSPRDRQKSRMPSSA